MTKNMNISILRAFEFRPRSNLPILPEKIKKLSAKIANAKLINSKTWRLLPNKIGETMSKRVKIALLIL